MGEQEARSTLEGDRGKTEGHEPRDVAESRKVV